MWVNLWEGKQGFVAGLGVPEGTQSRPAGESELGWEGHLLLPGCFLETREELS